MKHFKLIFGYNPDDYVSIGEDELVKAQVMFMEQRGMAIFGGIASIRGKDIIRILPDWHSHFGWNKGYKMLPEDNEYTEPLEKIYRRTIGEAKQIAEFISKEKKHELLNKTFDELKQLAPKKEQPKEISSAVNSLADKMRIT